MEVKETVSMLEVLLFGMLVERDSELNVVDLSEVCLVEYYETKGNSSKRAQIHTRLSQFVLQRTSKLYDWKYEIQRER